MRPHQRRHHHLLTFGILTLAICFGLSHMDPMGALRQLMTAQFTSTTGRIIQCDLAPNQQSATVRYNYTVDGRQLLGDCFSKLSTDVWFEFDRKLGSCERGSLVIVYYDVDAPEDSVLIRGWSGSGWFQMVWVSGVALGSLLFVCRYFQITRSQTERLQQMQDQVVDDGSTQRIRMTPGGLTPLTAGGLCGVVVSASTAGGLWAGTAMQFWNVAPEVAIGIGVSLGVAAGCFDYTYTLRGNERGRWELIIDHGNNTLQVPAFDAWGEPVAVPIDTVTGVSVEFLVAPDENDSEISHRYVLILNYRERHMSCAHQFHSPCSRNEANAMAEWICQSIGLERSGDSDDFPHELMHGTLTDRTM